jgi:hypothetical protein
MYNDRFGSQAGMRSTDRRLKEPLLLAWCLVLTLAASFVIGNYAEPVAATTNYAVALRQDRRPDRERPVVAPRDSTSSSSQTGSTKTSRPRLVRR